MWGFILKGKFATDVENVAYECWERATAGRTVVDGMSMGKTKYLEEFDRWMKAEAAALDKLHPEGVAAKGAALIRARRWVGVFFFRDWIARGAPTVPRSLVKKIFKPACTVSNHYLIELDKGTPAPFTLTFRNKIEDALDGAMA